MYYYSVKSQDFISYISVSIYICVGIQHICTETTLDIYIYVCQYEINKINEWNDTKINCLSANWIFNSTCVAVKFFAIFIHI